MPQLVGRICTICRERIPSDLDGQFCQACGNPVHEQCIRRTQEPMTCTTCGTNLRAADAVQAKEEEASEANIRRSPPPPKMDVEKAYQAYQSVRFYLAGVVALGLGCVLLFVPEMRSDAKNLSSGELASGTGALFVGICIIGAGWFASRR